MNNAFFYGLIPVEKKQVKIKKNGNEKQERVNPNNDKKEGKEEKKQYQIKNKDQFIMFLTDKRLFEKNETTEIIEAVSELFEKRLVKTFKNMGKAFNANHFNFEKRVLFMLAVALTHPSKRIAGYAERNKSRFIKTTEHSKLFLSSLLKVCPSLYLKYYDYLTNRGLIYRNYLPLTPNFYDACSRKAV